MSYQTFRTFFLWARCSLGAVLCVIILSISVVSPASASSTVPQYFNYQGRLMSSSGTNVADGTYAIKFSLYSQSSGGTPVWTASGTTAVPVALNVTVTNGLFSILLGDSSFQSQNSLSSLNWNQDGLYLGLTVGADSEMAPRKKLSSVPFAFNSNQLQGQYASSSVASTGGSLFSIHQTTSDSASAQRIALSIKTEGTNDLNDLLIVGTNASSDVFTVSRLGSVTTTGNLTVLSDTILGNANSDLLTINSRIASDLIPNSDLAYALGDATHRWLSLQVGTVTSTSIISNSVSSTNALFTNTTSTNVYSTTVSTTNLILNGTQFTPGTPATTATLQTITDNGANTTNQINAYGGISSSNLTATGTTSLQNTTLNNATATAVTSTYLYASSAILSTLAANLLSASQATATTLAFTNASGSSLLISGKNVCLADGTNCAVVNSSPWLEDIAANTIYTSTTNRSVFMGGSTTDTSGFVFSGGAQTGTSTVFIGGTTNTNLYVGTSTYGGGLNANFTLNGNDVLVQGQIGSIGGLFSATGVTVGTNSTIYGDGNLYKTSAGDFTLALNDSAANWRFSTNNTERFTVASSGNIGIGVTTPLEALDVSGTVRNLLQGNSNVSVASNTQAGVEPYGVAVSGRYAYVTEYTSNELKIFDVSMPSIPVRISTLPIGGGPDGISVNGSYAYVVNDSSSTLQVIDISNPASPVIVSAIGTGTSPKSIFVSGGFAYVVNLNSSTLQIFDISNPQQPKLKGSVSTDSSPIDVKVQGKYAYIASNFANTFQVVDVSNPALPVVVGTTGSLGSPLNQIAVSGRYAYATIYNNNAISVIDISNPSSPSAVNTISFSRPVAIAISGRYLFATTYALATDRLGIFDIQNASSITQVVDAPIGVYVRGIAVSGKNAYLTNSGDDTLSILDLDGVETSALLAHSAEVGSLSVLTNAGINNQLSVGGGLVVGSGGILSQGSLAISSTNTTSTFVFAVSTTNAEVSNRLTVGGVNVCLANGTNCAASGAPAGAYIWTDSPTNNTIYNTTTTRDVLIGGNTTDTANFILDKNGVTSTVIIGSGTGNANLLVGTTTYGGGLNSNFVMNGNDVFVQGMIGSQEGLFSATGVTVGTGSTIYGDGNLYKTTVGDFNLALNTASTSWRFKTAGQERFTVASSGNVGIGVSTPLEALDVSGTIRDVWQNQTMRFTSSTLINATISTFEVKGKYGYFTTQEAAGSLGVADLSNRDYPVVVGTSTVTGGSPSRLALSANTAIVLNQNTYYADILDISNPARPVLVTSTYLNDWVADVAMSGGFAYITTASNGLKVLDMSNPANPAIIGTLANIKERIIIQGRYLFSAASIDNIFRVVDISNPAVPVQVGTLTLAGDDLGVLAVNGRYVYTLGVNGYSTPIVRIIDISNPASPSVAATINSTGNYADGMVFGGRYLYLNNREVYDVSSSTNPTLVTNLPFNFAAGSVSGKYAYFANNDLWPTGDLVTMDLPGIETSSLLAHTAEVGSLSVLTNASIFNQLTVGGGLSVGPGGILSQGSLAISSTNTTSTIGFAVSTTNAEISNRLTVGGVNVCLYSGTNCPVGWNLWSESSTGNVVYMTNVNRDLLIGGSTSNTAGFIFDKGIGSSNVIIGGATDTNLYVGTTTYGGGLNANYAMSGNDIFAQGMVGSIEGLFSATGVTVGTGSTIYGDGNLYKTTAGDFNLSLNNAASNWRFKIAGAERLTLAASGNVGIGVTTPLEALDVSGTIQNILRVGQSFTTVTSTTVGDAPQGVVVVGHLAYVVNAGTSDNLQIWDVAYPQSPSLVGSVSVGNDPQNIQVAGRYVYIAHSGSQDLYVVDVSSPATPYVVGTLNLGANGDTDLFLAGSYLYTNKINGFNVVDISNPISPTIVTSVTEAGSTVGSGIYIQGQYLYVNTVDFKLSIYNIANPVQPILTTSTFTGVDGRRVVVNGSNAFVTGNNGNLAIVNIASSTAPTLDATYSGSMYGYGLAKAGRYLYVSSGSDGALRIMDVSSSTSPYLISSVSLAGGASEGTTVAGRYAYVTDAVNDKLSIVDVKGFETNGFNAGSAEIGSLQILNDAAIAGRLYLNGGLFVGAGGIMSQGALNINSTNTTSTINFALQAAVGEFTSRLTVGGSSVCLANGSNCPTGTTLWTESTVNNTLYQTNTGRDVLLGGSSTDTAGFIFDKGTTTSTVIIGSSSGNANLLVGTTTYGGGLNTNFVMDGNDVFVQGMIGSKEGLFSATGVTVGLGSTVYGDGNLYKTTAGDFTLSLNNAASNWRFRSGNQESLTVASTGNIGIGVSTPLEALDVSGTIQNILRVGQTFTVMSTTSTDNEPQGIAVAGHLVYVANNTDNTLQTFDATNPSNPSLISRLSLSGARSVAVGGKYAYVGTSNAVLVVDISTPGSPYQISTTAVGNQPSGMALSGRYLYVANEGSNTLSVIDVGDAVNPQVVATFALGGTVRRVTIQGKYLYLANGTLGTLQIVDISNPTAPIIVGTQDVGDTPFDVAVQGRYAYVTNYTSNNVSVVDVSNPVSPTGVATSTGYSGAGGIAISGRYLYVTNYGSNTSTVVDVSVATNPTVIGSIVTGNGPLSLQASGRYLYVANQLADSMSIVDIGGIETNGLNAASAEFGTLQVLNNASVAGQLSVGSDLIVGVGGIYSAGSITVSATNTTSTFIFAVSSTNGEFSNRLTVGGVNVCLANGNNCPGASVTSYIWSESSTNNTIYNSTSTRDILLGGSTTATAQFIFDKGTTVSTVIVGGQSDANLLVGNTTYPGGLNANFALGGNDMFVQGMVGSLEGLFSATGVTVGTGSTIYGDGYLYKTTSGDFTLNLNNAASNWRFQTGGTERLTVASSGNIGIGVATPLQALDVKGSISNIVRSSQTLSSPTHVSIAHSAIKTRIFGNFGYVLNVDNTFSVMDMTNPALPTVVTNTTMVGNGADLAVVGSSLYIADSDGSMEVYDVSSPSVPRLIKSKFLSGSSAMSMAISGEYAYITQVYDQSFMTVDIRNPSDPIVVTSTFIQSPTGVSTPYGIRIQGRYAYITSSGDDEVYIYDISNPTRPSLAGSVNVGSGFTPVDVELNGRYAYTVNLNNNTVSVIDVSNVSSPAAVTTLGGFTGPGSIALSGRYAYVTSDNDNSLYVIDVVSSTSPTILTSYYYPGMSVQPNHVVIMGRYAYVPDAAGNEVWVVDISGTETNGLIAASAEVGTLHVMTNGSVFNNFNVGGALSVGQGGIYSNGPLGVYATSTFSDAIIGGSLAIGTTSTNIGERLQVDGNVLIRMKSLASAESWSASGITLVNAPSARYQALTVWTGSKMIVWSDTSYVNTGAMYDPIKDSWTAMSTTSAPFGRIAATPIWTGSKMIVWGGYGSTGVTSTGSIYDPLTNSWKTMNTSGAPSARQSAHYVWTGSRMVVWGGTDGGGSNVNTGAIYDPVTDAWTTMTTTNAPAASDSGAAVWATPTGTSSKMIVWSGYKSGTYGNTGAMYDPVTDAWTTMSTTNAPTGRQYPGHIWTGSKMIVWGGYNGAVVGTGGVFDPVTNSWSTMTGTGAPAARREHSTIWTGNRMIVWGGYDMTNKFSDGALYDPYNDAWTTMTSTNAPAERRLASAVWTGSKMVIWGGQGSIVPLDTGSIYTPADYQGNLMVEGNGYFNGDLQVTGDTHAGGFYSKSGSDFAEYMPIDTASALGTPSAGDVVVLSSGSQITKSSAMTRSLLIGAITNRPAVVGNANDAFKDDPDHYALVSMLGQVDVKFSPMNGSISPGDFLMAGDGGYAVKAKGAGLVLGQALQAGDSTSSILTYIKPMFWAGDLLTSSGDANFINSNISLKPQGTASSSTQNFSSNLFSFQGSAWDEASGSSFDTSFSQWNETISASSSYFHLGFATGTNSPSSILAISNLGDMTVKGDLTVGKRLFLGSKTNGTGSTSTYIYVDDTLAPDSTYIATNADGWSTSSTYDYAERYQSDDNLTAGELVSIDTNNKEYVKRTNTSNDVAIGIVSTKPGFVTGGYVKGTYPVALAGRVPTKIIGTINIGDAIMASDVPGYGKKAEGQGLIVGYALESHQTPDQGTISVFIQPGWHGGAISTNGSFMTQTGTGTTQTTQTTARRSGLAKIYAGSNEVTVNFESVGGYPIVNVRPYGKVTKHFWVSSVNDRSFTIIIGETTAADLIFSWTAEASANGNTMSFSDNTQLPYDPTSGNVYGPVLPPVQLPLDEVSSTTSTN